MRVRTFRGREMNVIYDQIRAEVGDEAMVVSSRQGKNGLIEIDVALPLGATAQGGAGGGATVTRPTTSVQPRAGDLQERASPSVELSAPFAESWVAEVLGRQGCGPDLIERVSEATLGRAGVEGLVTSLEQLFRFEPSFHPDSKALAVLGPTGSGKTSSLAKLALRCVHELLENVVVLAVPSPECHGWDPRGAILEDAGIPIIILEDYKHFGDRIVEYGLKLSGVDRILIDLPGCSPFDTHALSWMRRELLKVPWVERLLCVPASSNEIDATAWLRRFDMGGPTKMIVTKLDETAYLGPLCTALFRTKRPVAFFSSGQAIPTDLEPASPRRLAWFLTRGARSTLL